MKTMLAPLARLLPGALLAVLTLVSSAWAGCAWVMWIHTPPQWQLFEAHSTEIGCKSAIKAFMANLKPEIRFGPTSYWISVGAGNQRISTLLCVPDTLDPRESTTSAR